jgi:hypothetical protein
MVFLFEMQRKLDKIEIEFCKSLNVWFETEYKLGKKGAVSACASFLGVSQGHMSQILKGDKCWKSEYERRKIADKIGVPYERMISGASLNSPSGPKDAHRPEKPIAFNDHLTIKPPPHQNPIDLFENKNWAGRVNALLLKIEKDPGQRRTVETILKSLADQLIAEKNAGNDS